MDSNSVVRALIRDRAKLLGYVWAMLRDHHLAEDVFQDVTVLAIERAGEIKDDEHLMLWSRKVARYKALETLRSKEFRMMTLDNDVLEMLEADWGHVDSLATGDEVDHLRSCMERLTPHAQRIVHLRYTEGLSGIQVAEIIKVKVRSVYVALARIHKALAECIGQRRQAAEVTHL